MKIFLSVLITAVTVNCLVTKINVKTAIGTLDQPHALLLPPLGDIKYNNDDAATKINATAIAQGNDEAQTTTEKPIINNENNMLTELSIEALLPPLFEANAEYKDATISTTMKAAATTTTTTTTTTTQKPLSTTIKPTTTTTTTTTPKVSHSITTMLIPTGLKIPDLSLDPLLPPLFDNDINLVDAKNDELATTSQTPITTSNKSYHQQQTQHFTDQSEVDKKADHNHHGQASNEIKIYNRPAASEKHVAESETHTKQVTFTPQQENVKLQTENETVTRQYVVKQKAANTDYSNKQNNYNFDLYFGSTTSRPAKNGLPTITPFPHRLGR